MVKDYLGQLAAESLKKWLEVDLNSNPALFCKKN
jgi:hypothetical protein